MNLADAIRQAAQKAAGDFIEPKAGSQPASKPKARSAKSKTPKRGFDMDHDLKVAGRSNGATDASFSEPAVVPESPGFQTGAGSVVRLELFLSPEQLSQLFRAFFSTQHSMMTLREAALYLRMHPSALERMAKEGELPAVHLEGRWRFVKSSLDEWLTLQAMRNGGEKNVA